jgi:hypothetical protein
VPSVWPLVRGDDVVPPPVIAVARPTLDRERWMIVVGHDKLLFDRELAEFELFDLQADPGEREEIGARDPARADAMLGHASQFLEQVVGGADSRRVRALAGDALPEHALPAPSDAPPGIVGAWAESTRPLDDSGLPVRLLVHAWIRSDMTNPYEVVLLDGDVVRASVPEMSTPPDPGRPLHDDVRTFKVYVEDLEQQVQLRDESHAWTLGSVRELAAATRRPPRE